MPQALVPDVAACLKVEVFQTGLLLFTAGLFANTAVRYLVDKVLPKATHAAITFGTLVEVRPIVG